MSGATPGGGGEGRGSPSSAVNALQVLAATASDDRLRERYENSSQSSVRSPRDRANSEEDDDAGSRNSNSSDSSARGVDGVSKRTGLRKGKWTSEEEEYATRFIHYFSSGLLTLPEGKTLRASLAEKLRCDPMRITKKYAGASCLGNKISRLCDRPQFSPQDVEMARREIDRLERRFRLRLSQGAGVLLPPEDGEHQEPVMSFERHQHAQTSVPAQTIQVDNLVHQQQQMNPQASDLPQAGAHCGLAGASSVASMPAGYPLNVAAQANNAAASANASSANAAAAAAAPFMSAYLAKLASNAQLAAASSLAPAQQSASVPAPAPFVFGAQQSAPAPAPLQVPTVPAAPAHQHNPQQMAQLAASLSLPTMLQGMNQAMNQAAVNSAAAASAASQTTANNGQLVQTLLLQITTQLQALATLSPATLRQIQLQILAATMASAASAPQAAAVPAQQAPLPAPVPAAPAPIPAAGSDAAAALMANFQLAAAGQQMGQLPTMGLPAAALNPNASLQGLFPGLAQPVPQAPVPKVPVQQAATLQVPAVPQAPVPQAAALQAQAHVPLLNPYGMNALAARNNTLSSPSPSQPPGLAQAQARADQGLQQGRKRSSPTQEAQKRPASNMPSAPKPTRVGTTNNNIAEFLSKMRQAHAEAVEKAQREQAEINRRGRIELASAGEPAFTKGTSRSSSSLINGTPANQQGAIRPTPAAKRQRREQPSDANGGGIVALLPFEHATTVSSGSGCTTNEGSTSSMENLLASNDETTRNEGSNDDDVTGSSSSMSDEDDCPGPSASSSGGRRRGCGPLRKRFGKETNGGGGGITRRNLADHNVRMAEEMKNQDN